MTKKELDVWKYSLIWLMIVGIVTLIILTGMFTKFLFDKTMERYITRHLLIARPIGKAVIIEKGKAVWMLRIGKDYFLVEGIR